MTIRVAIPDLISPSYFPAIAAVEMGFLPGATLELLYPVTKTYEELREGRLDFVGGASHAPLYAFKDWQGCRLLCALAQHMYWFLVVDRKLNAKRGDLSVVKGRRIGAAPGPVDGLKQMLKRAGITDAQIGPVPGAVGDKASFGLMAARALQEGKLDGFWANGMGAEVAVREGFGTVVLDARRDGTSEMKGYTFPALVCTEKTVRERPDVARAAIKAVKQAQEALKKDPNRATEIGRKLFPPQEASLIAELIRRDAPFYDPAISPQTVASMNAFARELGLLSRDVPYAEVVWKRLKGKVAIVTGAGSGIGKTLATRLAQDGAAVVIADLKAYDTAAAEIAKLTGARTLGLQVDVSAEKDVEHMAAETVKAFGRIDILVNNAALFSTLELKPFEKIPADEWRRVMDVNTLGVFLCCRACAPHMRKGAYGRIINLASGAPLKGVPLFLHYIASKGAVIAMTRGLARELGADNITVNSLAPGFTLSENVAKIEAHRRVGEITKATRAIKRDETPEDLVGAVSFLASADAAFITGQTLVVDGGSAML